MKREKRAGRSLGGGGIHSSGSLGDGAWQEGLKRREVSRSLAEARVLGGRGTQALRTRDSDCTSKALAGRASSGPARTRNSATRACSSQAGSRLGAASAGRGGKRCAHAQVGRPSSSGWGREGGVFKRELDPLGAAAMAAPSPSSPLPLPPGRRSGRRSPRPVHGVHSEASGLADAAREVFGAKSDLVWRGEEGTGDRRGPGLAGAAVVPVASAPPGSWQPEGLSVVEAKATRTQLLEEELSSLKEELALCQVSGLAAGLPVHSPCPPPLPRRLLAFRASREPSRDTPSSLHARLAHRRGYRLCPSADLGFLLIDALQGRLPPSPSSWWCLVPSAHEWSTFMN